MSDYYRGANPPLEPTVALAVTAGSLEFSVSYVVDYTKRTAMQDKLFAKIVQEVANSNGRLAWAPSSVTVINLPATSAPVPAQSQPLQLAATVAQQVPIYDFRSFGERRGLLLET